MWVSVACEANDKSPFRADSLDLDHKNSLKKNNDDIKILQVVMIAKYYFFLF